MTSENQQPTWDLSPVFSLIQSLSTRDITPEVQAGQTAKDVEDRDRNQRSSDIEHAEKNLGDFNRIWDFLGVQRDVPLPKVPTFEASTAVQAENIDSYTSDGALYYPPSSKSVKWRDEEEGLNLTDVQLDSPPDDDQLTKSQRKKRNRKARKAAEAEGAAAAATVAVAKRSRIASQKTKNALCSTIEPGSMRTMPMPDVKHRQQSSAENPTMQSQAHRKSTPILTTPTKQAMSPPPNPTEFPSQTESPKIIPDTSTGLFRPAQVTPTNFTTICRPSLATPQRATKAQTSPIHKPPEKRALDPVCHSLQKHRPVADPRVAPTSLTPNPSHMPAKHRLSSTATNAVTTATSSTARKRFEIHPLQFHSPLDRNWSLLLKLMQNFPEDRAHLLSPLQLSINRPVANGIHVFVDASNIIIGFHDTLKRARGIPQYARVPRVNLNFHALALLLERRRPVTKRVLAGSTPEISAFEEARQVGYETCILDKVWKAKELTERQRRFAARAGGNSSGYQSGSDSAGYALLGTNSSPFASHTPASQQQPKWVEQAVDEILHLKILESIVDTPSFPTYATGIAQGSDAHVLAPVAGPTMVLATGDAAEAEYSPGFQKMVQRALGKGWTVEVMAWSKSISAEYRRMTQSTVLEGKFKVIELDEYAEELFGESV